MKFKILLFALLFSVSHEVFSRWEWLNPLPRGNMLYTV